MRDLALILSFLAFVAGRALERSYRWLFGMDSPTNHSPVIPMPIDAESYQRARITTLTCQMNRATLIGDIAGADQLEAELRDYTAAIAALTN